MDEMNEMRMVQKGDPRWTRGGSGMDPKWILNGSGPVRMGSNGYKYVIIIIQDQSGYDFYDLTKFKYTFEFNMLQ